MVEPFATLDLSGVSPSSYRPHEADRTLLIAAN
jgi:hypothetical protein